VIKNKDEQQIEREFAEFIDAEPLAPAPSVDKLILQRVAQDLCPARWKVWSRLTLVEVTAGLLTLTICPQFGLGFGQHNEFLHALHAATTPLVFYLLCGLFFVSFGAALAGVVLTRAEIRTLGQQKYLYFAVYSLLVYLGLLTLGPEAFVVSSMAWVIGALLGNILTFAAVTRLRQLPG